MKRLRGSNEDDTRPLPAPRGTYSAARLTQTHARISSKTRRNGGAGAIHMVRYVFRKGSHQPDLRRRPRKHRPKSTVASMMDDAAGQIANEFIARYEVAWNHGAEAVAKLYTADSVLVGYVTAIGRPEIYKLLGGIIG